MNFFFFCCLMFLLLCQGLASVAPASLECYSEEPVDLGLGPGTLKNLEPGVTILSRLCLCLLNAGAATMPKLFAILNNNELL